MLSKYGHLSIEMMSVVARDDDEAMSDRNGLIAENANIEELPAEAVYEEVDETTGEIKEGADGGAGNEPYWAK